MELREQQLPYKEPTGLQGASAHGVQSTRASAPILGANFMEFSQPLLPYKEPT